MSSPGLSSVQANQLAAAVRLLHEGHFPRALAIAEALAREAPFVSEAQQLLGMARSEVGDLSGAERALRAAVAISPHNEPLLLHVATWLSAHVGLPAARDLLVTAPATAAVLTRLGLIQLQLDEPAKARHALERALAIDPTSTNAWHGLGNALRSLDDIDAAVDAYRRATQLAPAAPNAWVNLGVAHRLRGQSTEALECLYRAQKLGYRGPDLSDVINGVLADAGQIDDAIAGALHLVESHPDFAQAHETLAHIWLEQGRSDIPDGDPFEHFKQAADAQPGNRELQFRFLKMLLAAGRPQDVLMRIERATASVEGDPVVEWFAGEALDLIGEHAAAGSRFASAHLSLGDSPEFLNAYARHAFRSGRFDSAGEFAQRAVELDPANQEAWSHLGTYWRLIGDEREHWLFDYEGLVGDVELDTPPGFPDQHSFLDALKAVLDDMHAKSRQRVHQSVRNGSQTAGQLFGTDNAVIEACEGVIREAVQRWISALPQDPTHPFLSRRSNRFRFAGSWSVRLKSSGRHTNHTHSQGWMSSACYVSLPAVMQTQSEERAGWLQFGQPAQELGLELAPRRMIQPKAGRVVLFPSYMWHGTQPFTDSGSRLTIAFDVRPL